MKKESNHPMYLLAELHAKLLASPDCVKVSMTKEESSLSLSVELRMQSTETEESKEGPHQQLSGKMCQEFSTQKTTPLDVSLGNCQGKEENLSQGTGSGGQEDLLTEKKGGLPGESWTLNISESLKDAEESLLLPALEREELIPEECFLTPKHKATCLKEYALGRGEVLLRQHAELVAMPTQEASQLFLKEGGDASRLQKKKGAKDSQMDGRTQEKAPPKQSSIKL